MLLSYLTAPIFLFLVAVAVVADGSSINRKTEHHQRQQQVADTLATEITIARKQARVSAIALKYSCQKLQRTGFGNSALSLDSWLMIML